MTRLTVYKNPDGSGYLVDLQADINSHFATRVVAPLLPVEAVPFYASALNPVFEIEGARFVMATQGMAAVPLAACRTTPCKMPHRPRILRA